jgi:hypothetical protein
VFKPSGHDGRTHSTPTVLAVLARIASGATFNTTASPIRINMSLEVSGVRIINRTEKQRMHEFKKWAVFDNTLLPPFDYDPYPSAKMDDVVERDPIGHEITIEAECICNQPLSVGQPFTAEQRVFEITRVSQQQLSDGKVKCALTARHFETFILPAALAKVIRERNKKQAKEEAARKSSR